VAEPGIVQAGSAGGRSGRVTFMPR
jgi:hypothetical protein